MPTQSSQRLIRTGNKPEGAENVAARPGDLVPDPLPASQRAVLTKLTLPSGSVGNLSRCARGSGSAASEEHSGYLNI
jgi:hypothetical protein